MLNIMIFNISNVEVDLSNMTQPVSDQYCPVDQSKARAEDVK